MTDRLLAPALAIIVLGTLVAEKFSYATAEDAEPYHARVREAIKEIPKTIGDWVGTDTDIPDYVTNMLRPNAIVNRSYRSRKTGQFVTLLLVHCCDARNLGIHYPPVCYPSSGWELRETRRVSCQVTNSAPIEAAEYEFRRQGPVLLETIYVVDILLLPDGTITPDISAVSAVAADYQKRYWGAGHIQVVFGRETRAGDREEVFKEFVDALRPVTEAMGSRRTAEPVRR